MPFIRKKYLLLLLLFIFLLTRLLNLLLLPVFNDEAIYIHWGLIMINKPESLFYSLFDGKQPLLMWLFGIANGLISDPLLASRSVTVLFSLFSFWALVKIGKKLFSFPFSLLPALIYTITPLFVFFDHQALMESSLTTISLWSLYFLSEYQENKTVKPVIILGIILALGFYLKSTAIIFLLLSCLFLLFLTFRKIKTVYFFKPLYSLILVLTVFFIINLPLILQPKFNIIFLRGDRYNLTPKELLGFPITHWLGNFIAFIEISFWQLTPVLFLLTLLGIVFSLRKKFALYLYWFLGGLLIAVLTARGLSPRYLVCLLPLSSIFITQALVVSFRKKRLLGFLLFSTFIVPLSITILLIFKPLLYFNFMDVFTKKYSQKTNYVTENTAGYGLKEVRNYLEEKAKTQSIIVGVRLDAGNPENALFSYYFNNPNIKVTYLDKQIIPPDFDLSQTSSTIPIYFVSRSQHQGGLENYLIEEARFLKPEGKSYFGVFRLKTKN